MSTALLWELNTAVYPYPPIMLVEAMGSVPGFLDESDPRPATAQFAEKYIGGWDARRNFALIDGTTLKYPGDPLMHPIAWTSFRGERVMVYPFGYVCVRHTDMTFEVARLD